MSIRSGLIFALASTALLSACESGSDGDNTVVKRSIITLTPVAPGNRNVRIGETVKVKVQAKTIEGAVATPAKGATVRLEVTGPGTVDADELKLDASGSATFTFAACEVGDDDCEEWASVAVTAATVLDGVEVDGNIVLTLKAPAEQPLDCSACGEGCEGVACSVDGETGVCGATACVLEDGGPVDPGDGKDVESNALFRIEAGLFDGYGDVLDPARIAINSPEPVEVRVVVTNAVSNAPVKNTDVVVTTYGGIGLVALDKETAASGRAPNVTGKTNDKGVFSAFLFAGAQMAQGGVLVQSNELSRRIAVHTVQAGILAFQPGDDDHFVRIMGVAQSGYREQNTLRFRLFDTTGQPFVGGATMHFEVIGNPGGVRLFPTSARIDENSEATVNLRSGPTAGTVVVRASAVVDNDPQARPATVSDQMAIVGAKVSGRNIAVSCEKAAVPALSGHDCSFMKVDENTLCTAVLGDRYNNTIGRPVSVFWSTEAGLFGPPSSTESADPDVEPAAQPSLGRTQNTLRTLNARMPVDVEPAEDEVYRVGSPGECAARDGGIRTFNPRDGLVTFIVHTKGEEGFWDENNNGVYDEGEKFLDQGEPFIDANDNGVWDPGEEFIDTNDNGVYDGPNGVWDADTTVWAVGHILFTGTAYEVTWTPTSPDDRSVIATVEAGERLPFSVNWKDENLNQPASSFSSYDITVVAPALGSVDVQSLADKIADTYGFSVTQRTVCPDATDACKLETNIGALGHVDGFTVKALYTAPEPEKATFDLLQASATVKFSDGDSLTTNDQRTVDVEAAEVEP